jgi:RNA polymerase sigma-70 factor (ECF subfamily)
MDAISRLMKRARAIVVRRGAPLDDADDIVQEAFARLEAYTRTHEIRSQDAFVVHAALNISRDQARRRKTAPFATGVLDLEALADPAPRQDQVLRAQERIRRANAGLEQLDPLARRCLLAKRLEGLTSQQIAAREELSVSAVEKRVARAIVFLTKWMDGW